MCQITDFQPDHILAMDVQPHQKWMQEAIRTPEYAAGLARDKSRTMWADGKPIACLGQVTLWEGNAEVWSVFASDIGERMTSILRATKRLIDQECPRRVQAYVDAEFPDGITWMFHLGFKVEGKLARYFPNGNDAFLFAKVDEPAAESPFAVVDSFGDRPMIDKIMRLESEMARLPQATFETTHHFSHGIYAREIFIPAGSLLTGKIHATDHISIVSRGDISVLTEGGIERIKAPATIVSKAGMKRVGYAHADTVWTTIHGTHETDLKKLEVELIVPTASVPHDRTEVLP